MIEAVVHRLKCDQCHSAWVSPVADNPDEARTKASIFGWAHVYQNGGWYDQCPRCVFNARKRLDA